MSFEQEVLIDLLREVNRQIVDQVRDVLSQHELAVTTMIIAKHIKSEPGITISELARRTGIAKSHISNIIKELSQRGWVKIQTDASDHRLLRLFLTQSATKQVELVGSAIRKRLSDLLSGLPEARTTEIIVSLQDVQNALKQAKEKRCSNND